MRQQLTNEAHPSPAPGPQLPAPAKLMVRVPNWLGDAVMALPALGQLRRIFDAARITLVARPSVAELFDGEGLSDDLIVVSNSHGFVGKTRRFFDEARRLRRVRFDLAVLLTNSFASALTARAGGAKQVVGYARDARGLLLTETLAFEPNYERLHQVRYYLNLVAEIERRFTGESRVDLDARPALRVTESARERARQMLAGLGVDTSKRLVALNPGATNSRAKRWLPERFAATADLLIERDGFAAFIVGTAGDREAASAVTGHMRAGVADLTGRTTLAELKAALACAQLVISNDTGAAHVAAALGVPTVTVFGPTEDFATRPLAQLARVVRRPVECSPCMLRDCPIDHRCMTGVEVTDVERAAQSLLTRAAR